uniref:Transducin beta-like protein 3 n=2 Tax=Lygus hesperus TaxID=30085 RepID=A0A0A9YHX5_LYGHE
MSPNQIEMYEPTDVLKEFYTGGDVQWTNDGKSLLCQCGPTIQIVDLAQSKPVGQFGESDESFDGTSTGDDVLTFTLSDNNEFVVAAYKSGLFKIWRLEDKTCVKHWKSIHKGPVARVALSPNGAIMASGGTDSTVRLWDLRHHACLKTLRGIQGVTSVLKLILMDNELLVIASGDDSTIKVWNNSGAELKTFSGHYSPITDILVTPDFKHLISSGRDRVVILWDFHSGQQINVLPMYEGIEGMILLPKKIVIPGIDVKMEGGIYVATGGSNGCIRIWDVRGAKELYVQKNSVISKASEEDGVSITHLLYNQATSCFLVVSAEHNMFVQNIDSFDYVKQLVGFSDEVLDITFVGKNETHLAVATNSKDIKVYKLSNMDSQILQGHTDFVMALSHSKAMPEVFASASKDMTIKLWQLLEDDNISCIASFIAHGKTVTSLKFAECSAKFMVSGSEESTLKVWKLPKINKTGDPIEVLNIKGLVAHDKDINGVAVSPNDQIVASASMDKTTKLWDLKNLSPLGTLKGHRRGVWSVVFSPFDQVVLTCSADTTLKIWSISDLSCLKTLEGHEASVIRAAFLNSGFQIVSAGGDGLLKLWSLKTAEVISTFDHHRGKVWALAVGDEEKRLITGGSDSRLIFWKDVTEEKKLEEARKHQEMALKEQELANLLKEDDLLSALQLAISLNKPATVLKIVQDVMDRGDTKLEDTVKQLCPSEKEELLGYVSHWNTNSKTCYPAQVLISSLMSDLLSGNLTLPKHILETLIPYTEKHFQRLTNLLQDVHLVEYTRILMKPSAVDVEMTGP